MTIEASSKLYNASKVDNNHKSISNSWKKTQNIPQKEIIRRTQGSEEKILVYSYTDFKKRGRYACILQGEAICETNQLTTDMQPHSLFF